MEYDSEIKTLLKAMLMEQRDTRLKLRDIEALLQDWKHAFNMGQLRDKKPAGGAEAEHGNELDRE